MMDMDNLVQGFMDEAAELIGSMEESLLMLESDQNDKEAIGSVFRVMHTLKGSGAMFGFNSVTSFTHLLENIYESIRSGKIELNEEILNLTFESVDLIKRLLISTEDPKGDVKKEYDRLIAIFEDVVQNKKTKKIEETISPANKIPADELRNPTYYIYFAPNEDIMKNGTNPLYLIDELMSLGKGVIFVHVEDVPDFLHLEPQKCLTSWDIVLSSEVDLSEILDVFIFVEDDSKIDVQKISEHNLLAEKSFVDQLPKYVGTAYDSAIVELQGLAEEIEKNIEKTAPEPKHKKAEPLSQATQQTREESAPVKQSAEHQSEQIRSVEKKQPEKEKPSPAPVQLGKRKEVPHRSKVSSSIRVSSEKVETLINLVSEMVTTQARLNLLASEQQNPEIIEVAEIMEKLTRQLRDNAFEISLIPISSLVTRFQRLIRDLSKELNKDVRFVTEGTDTELDKTIIESLSDPLMHIFRNAIDHGFESKEERIEAGKPEQGQLKFKAYYSGTSVYIDISDDGGGINATKVRQIAIKKGLIYESQQMSKQQLNELIMLPGFSTSESITDISGRGVGMDVVKKNINKIQGEIEIFSEEGKGTTFSLKLPLTLSIIDGLVVRINDIEYIIPILVIKKIKPIKHSDIQKSFNNMLTVDGEQIPFLYLRDKFQVAGDAPEQEEIVVVHYASITMGIIIDRVIKESQVVVKSIGKHFHGQDIVSGASIMGDGTVALVLDTNKIIDKYSR